jgi:hypothetical protein
VPKVVLKINFFRKQQAGKQQKQLKKCHTGNEKNSA